MPHVSKMTDRPVQQISLFDLWMNIQQNSYVASNSLSLASVKSRLVVPVWYQLTWVVLEKGVCLGQRFSNWGPRTKGGPRRVPTESARGFRKVVIVCTVFNNLRPICFQICTHKSVTQSQCIAWKCCRGLARQAFC